MCDQIVVQNPADEQIANLIEELTSKIGSIFADDDKLIKQITELRASMRPIIHIHH